MKVSNQPGFTIIETMLFLGITGLLVMGVLVGAGTQINVQRYRDSVTSLQSNLQQQYSDVANVSNDGSNGSACGDSPRGQSDCVILGKFIKTIDGQSLSIQDVIGTIPNSSITSTNDIAVLKLYNIRVSSENGNVYDIEWNSSLTDLTGRNAAAFSMLTLRSPVDGTIRTFIDGSHIVNKPSDLLVDSALTSSINVCVGSSGLFNGGKSAITVAAGASNASAIEVKGEATSGCK